jgi:hypothetical protein
MATSIGKRSIYKGPAESGERAPLQQEGICAEAGILPGMLVQQAAANAGLEVNDTAATASFNKKVLVANRNELMSRNVDEVWTENDTMQALVPRSGEFFNVMVAAGNNITDLNTGLTVDGAGKLTIAANDGTVPVLFLANEIVNVTADTLVEVYRA